VAFAIFNSASILRVNYGNMAGDKLRQPSRQVFSIKRKFQQIEIWPLFLRSFPYGGIKFGYAFKMRDFCQYPLFQHENGCR